MAQRALMLRGIPEAAAMLAVSIAAEGKRKQSSLSSQRLVVSVERLDLGELPSGEGATVEFEVQGGLGRVLVESDYVRVEPQEFGAGVTRIRVEVKPMFAGVLWTKLRLVTVGETVEVPLVAQWTDKSLPFVSSPQEVKVASDDWADRLNELFREYEKIVSSDDRADLGSVPEAPKVSVPSVVKGVWREVATLRGHEDSVYSVAFSPDGKFLASGSVDTTVKVWEVGSWREVATLRGHGDYLVYSVAFSPDGKFLASGSGDKTVKVWEVGRWWWEVATLMGHKNVVDSVAFSPDGKFLASGSGDKTVKVWEVGSWREVATLRGHEDSVYSVAFSPDGKFLASGSVDTTVKVWEIGSWREVITLMWHVGSVRSVTFSPDGKFLASGSWDMTIKVWEVGSWREVATLRGHGGRVWSVTFSPDGKFLASGSSDKTVKVWEVGR
jgi:WD40 repeat protein